LLLLTSTSDLIQVVTGSAVTSMNVQASFVDWDGTVTTPGRKNTNITAQATTTVVAAPGSNVQRNVKSLSIYNAHASTSNSITLQHYDGSTTSILVVYTLLAGETLYYVEAGYWAVLDVSGKCKISSAAGSWIKTTTLTVANASAQFSTGPSTNKIRVVLQAAGGAGGGAATAASSGSAGGGGSAGGRAEKLFSVTPNTTYTYALPSTSGGVSGANGGNGSVCSFTVGATTVTANGGLGGTTATGSTLGVNLGGASPAIATNGDVNLGGAPGAPGFILSAAIVMSGYGGASRYGGGGAAKITQAAGGPGIGPGGGAGGGALVSAGASNAGGNGTAGIITVEEYA
jgi:hypothetical protein